MYALHFTPDTTPKPFKPSFKKGRTAPADNAAPPGPGTTRRPLPEPKPLKEEDGFAKS